MEAVEANVGVRPPSVRSHCLTILTGCLTRRLPECAGETGLVGKAERQRDVRQWPVALHQQCFRAREAPGADVAMRGLPRGLFEGPRKMVLAQARNRGHSIEGEIALQVRFNVIQHALESAPAERASCERDNGLAGRSPDVILDHTRAPAGWG